MANNDMEVIIYKILSYLYESIKSGHKTCLEDIAWNCKLFDITRDYWLIIIKEMIEDEYISGLKYVEAKDMQSIIEVGNISITKKGREYLKDNNMMNKVGEMLGEAFKITLGSVIGML